MPSSWSRLTLLFAVAWALGAAAFIAGLERPHFRDLHDLGRWQGARTAARLVEQSGESELVILVTPHLGKPLPKDQIRLPTDDFIEPNATEFYLFGRIEGKAPPVIPPAGSAPSARNVGGVEGGFGQSVQ